MDKPRLIDGSRVEVGDVVLGLSSSGLHSNGYSLGRKLLEPLGYNTFNAELGRTLGEALLEPTQLYVLPVLSLLDSIAVKAIANITGGGFYENIPRVLPQNTLAKIKRGSWNPSPLFAMIQSQGRVEEREMFTTFNMGIGLVLVVARADVAPTLAHFEATGIGAFEIGMIEEGDGDARVELV